MTTWRDVQAPSFGESNRLLVSGQEQLQQAVMGLGSQAKDMSNFIKEDNTQRLVDRLSNVGEGLSGMEALKGLESSTLNADALTSKYGSSVDRNRLESVVGATKSNLERQAFGEFNELLSTARATGDFTGLSAFTSRADTLLDDASGMREAAVDSQKQYEANSLYNQWQSGAINERQAMEAARAGSFADNQYMQPLLGQIQQKLEVQRREGIEARKAAVAGNVFLKTNTLKEQVASGMLTSEEAMARLTEGLSAQDIGNALPFIQGAVNEFSAANLARQAFTPNEAVLVEGGMALLEDKFKQGQEAIDTNYQREAKEIGGVAEIALRYGVEGGAGIVTEVLNKKFDNSEDRIAFKELLGRVEAEANAAGKPINPLVLAAWIDKTGDKDLNWLQKTDVFRGNQLNRIQNELAAIEKDAEIQLTKLQQLRDNRDSLSNSLLADYTKQKVRASSQVFTKEMLGNYGGTLVTAYGKELEDVFGQYSNRGVAPLLRAGVRNDAVVNEETSTSKGEAALRNSVPPVSTTISDIVPTVFPQTVPSVVPPPSTTATDKPAPFIPFEFR